MYKEKQKDRLFVLISTSILLTADIITFNMLSAGYVILCAIATSMVFGFILSSLETSDLGDSFEEMCIFTFFAYLLKPIALVLAAYLLIRDYTKYRKRIKQPSNNTKFWT